MENQRAEKANIGRRLRAIRERAHFTIAEAAKAAGVQPLAVQKWERGTALPSIIELRELMTLYGVMAYDILYDISPLEIGPEQVRELVQASKSFSPSLRARIDFILAMFSRGKEPTWKVTL